MTAISTIRRCILGLTLGMTLGMPFGLAATLTVLSGQAQAQNVTVSAGMAVQAPAGWVVRPAEPNKIVFVGPDQNTTIIAILDTATQQAVTQQLTGQTNLGNGIVLTPARQPYVANDFLANDFVVAGATAPAHGIVTIKRFTDGRALALVGIAPQASAQALRTMQYALMQSIAVGAINPQQQANNGWTNYLRGRYLARFYSGSGYHERHQIWLCSDGSYAASTDGGGSTAGVASGAFRGGNRGRWIASGETNGPGAITLTGSDGQQRRLNVQIGSDGLYLNGQRWLRGDNKMCR